MKTVKITLATSILLALAFIFSCTSENNGGGGGGDNGTTNGGTTNLINCNIGGVCVPNYTLEQCLAIPGATVVATCQNNSTVNCSISGICTQLPNAETCINAGGTVVGSCGTGGGSSSSNFSGGNSSPGGTGNSSSSAGGTGNAVLNCNMTATSAAFDFNISPTPVVQCSGMNVSPSLVTWQNNPPEDLGRVAVKVTATCGGVTQEAICGEITVKAYCDYGYATTDHPTDNCQTITEENFDNGEDGICDYEYGVLVKSCNSTDRRDDLVYCNWGPVTSRGGGCYRAEENSTSLCRYNDGTPVTRCPNNSL